MLDFLAYLEFERGLSRNTLEAYRSDLLQYGRFLAPRQVSALDAGPADVGDFLTALATGQNGSKPASPATIHRKTACLRSFYRHLRRDGLLETDPTAALSAPRRSRKLPHVLTRGEVEKLLAQPAGSEPAAPPRPGAARADVRLRAARVRGDRPGGGRRGPRRAACSARAARARRSAWCRSGRWRARARGLLPRARPPGAGEGPARAAAVRELPRRAAHPPGPLQDRPPARPERRAWPTG